MRGNPGLDLAYTCERAVPSQLQFRRDQPVLRIDGVILSECPIGAVARRLEVARQRITNPIAAAGRLGFGLDGRSYRCRFDNPQKSFLDGVVDTQSSESDAAWLAIVEQTPPTGIARNVMLGAYAAHLDQLLPVTAVAGETRDFPRRDRTDLAQADLGHHSIKAGARDAACRRAPEIVIDRFDARPAQRRQTIAHRILQGAALAIVENLMGGGLPDIQDRLALQMVRPDLLRHHSSPPVPERGRRRRDPRSGGPSASSAYGASRRATPAIAASAPRRRARRTDRTDVHCCEDGDER